MDDDDLDAAGDAHEAAAERTRRRIRRVASQVYSVRVPVDRLEDLRQLAAARGEAPTALMRQWVLERLEAETLGDSPPQATPRRDADGACAHLACVKVASTVAEMRRATEALTRATEAFELAPGRS